MFSRVWQPGQTPDANRIRLALALLLSDEPKGIGRVIETLEAASKSASARDSDAVSASLAEAYFTDRQYGKALAISEDLLRKLPGSTSALRLALRAAYGAGGEKEAGRITAAHLTRFKDDVGALRAVAVTALVFGDTDRSTAIEKQILDSGRGQATDYNQIAWADLMAGKVTNATLEIAKKGLLLGSNGTGLLHTLAAVQAELAKVSEARAALLQRMVSLGDDEPDDDDWYVFGRIAESYGLIQDATAMYRRLQRPRDDRTIPASSYALAQKRLKVIAGK
jgi:tetratricopeptide (TPR) repeat protein